ncbi:MAG TPA: hypothetical protein VFC47_09190 [Caulobacteraceae bacterium]|nr:hypothetical protein [Caulobacteraceae bacterium]
MKSRTKMALAGIALALATGIGFTAVQAQAPQRPEFRKALEHLKEARGALDFRAWPDRDGHRTNAIRLIQQAMDETRRAMDDR